MKTTTAFKDVRGLVEKVLDAYKTGTIPHTQIAQKMLQEVGAWTPDYFTDEAIEARSLIRKGKIPHKAA